MHICPSFFINGSAREYKIKRKMDQFLKEKEV